MPAECLVKPYTILAIDGDPQSLKFLSEILTTEYEVLVEEDSGRGVELAQNAKPDLIILDSFTPAMNGFEVLGRLKANAVTAIIPVILLTSDSSVEDQRLGLLMGAVDYIAKPISPPLVLARVATQLVCQGKPFYQLNVPAETTAVNSLRDGFIAAFYLLIKNSKVVKVDALLDGLMILFERVTSDIERNAFNGAAKLALLGLSQDVDDIFQVLSSSRVVIDEMLGVIGHEDLILNIAWEFSSADRLLQDGYVNDELNTISIPARLLALALVYHVEMLKPGINVSARHVQAFEAMVSHPAYASDIFRNKEILRSELLVSSYSFFNT